MANRKFTETVVRKLLGPPADSRKGSIIHYEAELPGFGVRITRAGFRSYVFRYTINRRERIMTIGNILAWTLERARAEARRLRVLVDQGTDPQDKRLEARDAVTADEIIDRWIGNDGSDGNSRKKCDPS
jgi:hypothetical protein